MSTVLTLLPALHATKTNLSKRVSQNHPAILSQIKVIGVAQRTPASLVLPVMNNLIQHVPQRVVWEPAWVLRAMDIEEFENAWWHGSAWAQHCLIMARHCSSHGRTNNETRHGWEAGQSLNRASKGLSGITFLQSCAL